MNTKPNKGSFQKGHKPWNYNLKGIHISPRTEFKKGGPVNEKHPGWTGDRPKYGAAHVWINRHFVKPATCEHCGTSIAKRFEWASKAKIYTRDRKDWLYLCKSCHIKYDMTDEWRANMSKVASERGYRGWVTRRKNAS